MNVGFVAVTARLAAVVATVSIASCSGGGGSSGGSGGGPDLPVLPSGPPPSPTSFPTNEELNANYGIGTMNARTAYAAGSTGSGVTVAVIDSGIDVDHPEFAGRLSNRSTDIVTGTSATLDDEDGHGTHLAGIIGAAADGKGVVGVAYKSKLLAIRADLRNDSDCDPGECFADGDLARAIDYAVDNGAKVINLSLGRRGTLSPAYQAALQRAANRDVLIVAAGGNGGDGLIAPADLAADGKIGSHLIAAGAADKNGNAWSGNAQPDNMALAESFLLAPGVDIRSTYLDGGYRNLTGTSMATAQISGAAALVRDYFPSLSMEQVGRILLDSARDLGPDGTDRRNGRGHIDLARALQPMGAQAVPMGDDISGPSVSLASTSLSLGRAFGDALSNSSSLKSAMFLDGYDRPYRVNLADRVDSDSNRLNLEPLLFDEAPVKSVGVPSEESALGFGMQFAFVDNASEEAIAAFKEPATSLRSGPEAETPFRSAHLSRGTGNGGRVDFGTGLSTSWLASQDHVVAGADQLFLGSGELWEPTGSILDRGHAMRFAQNLQGGTSVQVGFIDSTANPDDIDSDGGADGRMMRAAVQHRIDRATLSLGFSFLDEEDSMLGSTGSGGFAMGSGSQSQFLDATARWSFTPDVHAIGRATFGNTLMGSDGGMISDWSNVYSNSFAMGLVADEIVRSGDRIGLMVAQPLRVASASATADVATSRDLDGNVQRSQERVDMEPSGREVDFQIAYTTPVGPESTVGSWVMLRSEPGHDADAPMDLGIGLKLSHYF